ncbi:MAG: hypothetical protein N2234_00140, partial [Planctomycetota bacterium]|nr:hypothetical protein [Planctomycetota bacterium]
MRLVCILITTLFFSVWIAAQQSEDDLQTNSSVSLNAFSDPEGIIDEVRSRLKQQKFREGIELLQILLEKTLTEASFAGKLYHRSENVYIPLDDFCVQLLREMPLGGYDTYITLYGATAERSLEQALSSGNTEGIETVSRLYPLTEAGQKALLYLADTALESGDGAKALYYLNRSIQTTGRRSTLTSLKMAAAMLIQTLKESAKEILLSLDDKTLSKEEAAIKAKLLEQTKGSTTTSSSRKQDIYNSFYDSSSSIAIPQDWRTVLFRG